MAIQDHEDKGHILRIMEWEPGRSLVSNIFFPSSIIHSFTKFLFHVYYVPGIAPDTGNMTENKTKKSIHVLAKLVF